MADYNETDYTFLDMLDLHPIKYFRMLSELASETHYFLCTLQILIISLSLHESSCELYTYNTCISVYLFNIGILYMAYNKFYCMPCIHRPRVPLKGYFNSSSLEKKRFARLKSWPSISHPLFAANTASDWKYGIFNYNKPHASKINWNIPSSRFISCCSEYSATTVIV